MTWPRQKLELLAADDPYSFVGGPFGSKLTSRDYVDDGVPVIRGSNLNNGRFLDMDDFVFVSDSKAREDLSSNLAKPGDLVFTQRGTLGQVAIIPEEGISDRYVVSQSQMKLTVDDTKVDRLFLYYYFSSREAVERIMNFASSSGVPHINLTVLRNFEVPVPPLRTQTAIASILSAYDHLIENNRRRIQLLEQAARLLYKEWFVHLRFPGHEHVTITDGVPEGWEKKHLGDIIRFANGKAMKPGQEGEYHVYGSNGIIGRSEGYLHENGIIIGRVGAYCGSVEICRGRFWASDNTIVAMMLGEPVETPYLFHMLKDMDLNRFAGGAAQPLLTQSNLKVLPIVVPPLTLRLEFNEFGEQVFTQRDCLVESNAQLAKARDLLLPRLMNGEVAV